MTRAVRKKMEAKMFISPQCRLFLFVDNIFIVISLFCTMTWRVNNYVSQQRKGVSRRNENAKGKMFIITLIIS